MSKRKLFEIITLSSGSEDSDCESDHHIVDKILGKRVVDGVTEYNVKWMGYPVSASTWKRKRNLTRCKDLITKFENELEEREKNEESILRPGPSAKVKQSHSAKLGQEGQDSKVTVGPKVKPSEETQIEKVDDVNDGTLIATASDRMETQEDEVKEFEIRTTFDRNLVPERIIGATMKSGEMVFLMRWVNDEWGDLVRATDAKTKWPQTVIKYYESQMHVKRNGHFEPFFN